ncbi:hypothetical protein DFJ43DRAFT_1158993 [Lentinula guzmanii]|uniref:Uncharacterized protein n=1 Tax=Lentinula guzmanii TaxID=2804957 RepID=A0AA38MW34_9AGAR|nr:hypothetical protein DFJ43DRAFT_1158993 [Lentinula guzmanii]
MALLVDSTTTQCVGEPLVEYEWSLTRPTEVEGEADDHSVSEFRIPLDCCGDVSSDKNRVMVTEGICLALQLLSLDFNQGQPGERDGTGNLTSINARIYRGARG